MTTTTSLQQTHETARKVCEYLGIEANKIGDRNQASIYIVYSHGGTTYELRISDHCANPLRTEAKKATLGYTIIECGNDWPIAKNTIDRKIFGRYEKIEPGSAVNHPNYGQGVAVEHDIEKDKLTVDFSGTTKSFFATTIIDRGWVTL